MLPILTSQQPPEPSPSNPKRETRAGRCPSTSLTLAAPNLRLRRRNRSQAKLFASIPISIGEP